MLVLVRDLYDHRRGRGKDAPTVGTDEVPLDPAPAPYAHGSRRAVPADR